MLIMFLLYMVLSKVLNVHSIISIVCPPSTRLIVFLLRHSLTKDLAEEGVEVDSGMGIAWKRAERAAVLIGTETGRWRVGTGCCTNRE